VCPEVEHPIDQDAADTTDAETAAADRRASATDRREFASAHESAWSLSSPAGPGNPKWPVPSGRP
jgi:molybdopterin-guanine dinucleotide biosynthesis protein